MTRKQLILYLCLLMVLACAAASGGCASTAVRASQQEGEAHGRIAARASTINRTAKATLGTVSGEPRQALRLIEAESGAIGTDVEDASKAKRASDELAAKAQDDSILARQELKDERDRFWSAKQRAWAWWFLGFWFVYGVIATALIGFNPFGWGVKVGSKMLSAPFAVFAWIANKVGP